jgi:predicted flap endonuclease-1-like 5' DNA nuclease
MNHLQSLVSKYFGEIMNWLLWVLLVAVGLAVGVLVTLIVDGRYLGGQLATAVAENHRLQQKVRSLTSRLAAAKTRVEQLGQDLDETTEQIEDLTQLSQSQQEDLTAVTTAKESLTEKIDQLTGQLEELRTEHEQASRRLAAADVELNHLREDLAAAEDKTAQLVSLEADKQVLQSRLDELQTRFKSAQRQLKSAGLKGKNQIEIVRGIGPTYASRLHEAGIHSLADLAEQSVERVAEIVGLKTWQQGKPQAWIDEAKELASAFEENK